MTKKINAPKKRRPEKKSVKGKVDVEVKPCKRNLQYHFNHDELLGLGKDLSKAQIDLRGLDDDKKQAMDEWKSRISTKEAEITSLSNRVDRGYEYRDIDCELVINEPPGKKTVRRLDTGEVISVEDLSTEEKQRTLKLEDAENPGEKAPAVTEELAVA